MLIKNSETIIKLLKQTFVLQFMFTDLCLN